MVQVKYIKWGPDLDCAGVGCGGGGGVGGTPPDTLHALKYVLGASVAPFCPGIHTCKFPSVFGGKSTSYGALASSGLRCSHVR